VRLRAASAALALTALAAAAGPARADDAASPPPLEEMAPSRSTPGWSRQANSLLLYGADGTLSSELALREPEESGLSTRETAGGVAPDAATAWTLERRLVWSPGRTKLLESRRVFRLYGAAGAELWRDEAADLPERGEPVLFSSDGKTLLLSRRGDDGWSAEARDGTGRVLVSIGPFPRLISMALTPNGRFALARWGVPDKSDTHTFVDLATKARRDVPSSELVLGLARIGDDGVARSGSKTVFAFDLAASTAAAPAPPAAPAAQAETPDEPTATLAEETDPAVIEVRDKLMNDPALPTTRARRPASPRRKNGSRKTPPARRTSRWGFRATT
jgi:hypothetical protein